MSFPSYPKYRASGVAWLGDIPEHWGVRKLKYLCLVFPSNVDKKSNDGETPVRLCNYTDVYYNDEVTSSMDFMLATASADQIEKFSLRSGDAIITKDSETADDIAVSAFVPRDLPGVVCGYHLAVVRPRPGTHGAYIKRIFDSYYAKASLEVRANGLTRVGLGQYQLDNVELAVPLFDEQQAIAAFLDRETAKIDALVAEQERLIELLNEKRQAVVSNAVTEGFNLDCPLKDSGISWLGEVPAHWTSCRVKAICSFVTSGPRGWSERIGDEGALFIQSGDLDDNLGVAFASAKRVQIDEGSEAARTRLQNGDVLVCITGAKTGNVAVCAAVPEAAYVNQHLCLVRPTRLVASRFLAMVLKSVIGQTHFERDQYGLKQGLGLEDVKNCPIFVPPLSEQEDILRHLDATSHVIGSLLSDATLAINLLQERRSALISAAVTGQIDVRSLVPREAA
jgi:type I restriction enzyme S subunit